MMTGMACYPTEHCIKTVYIVFVCCIVLHSSLITTDFFMLKQIVID